MTKEKKPAGLTMSFTDHVVMTEHRRLINGEYQRGFLEGYQSAARDMAGAIDGMLTRFNHVAVAGRYDFETTTEKFDQ
ncbi:MAG: hypothetical protein RBQ99_07340 [Trichlorobacter sp.]|nr:hypothetical protein [Trichlorobacter sp.]